MTSNSNEMKAGGNSQQKKRGPKVDMDRTIKIVSAANPKKQGTRAHQRFSLYRDGMTVGEAIEAGVTLRDIRHDVKAKNIELSAPS